VYQNGYDATSPAAYTFFLDVYKNILVFNPPSYKSNPLAKSTTG